MLEIAGITIAGVRENNEDRIVVNHQVIRNGSFNLDKDDLCLAAVFDGLGGEGFGDEAAELAAQFISASDPAEASVEKIKIWLEKANQIICDRQSIDRSHRNMATTTAGLVIQGENFFTFNIGDSRIYRFRKPYLLQLSEDHSVAQELLSLGLRASEEHNHVITRYLGGHNIHPHIVDGTDQSFENDLYLICTDGLWSFVDVQKLRNILSEVEDLSTSCAKLVQTAIDNGSDDNISIVMIRRLTNG